MSRRKDAPQFSMQLTEAESEALKSAATESGKDKTVLVREAIANYIPGFSGDWQKRAKVERPEVRWTIRGDMMVAMSEGDEYQIPKATFELLVDLPEHIRRSFFMVVLMTANDLPEDETGLL